MPDVLTVQRNEPLAVTPLANHYYRHLHINSVVLDATDLERLGSIVSQRNEAARRLQATYENVSNFESSEHLSREIERCMRFSYDVHDTRANSVSGFDRFDTSADVISANVSKLFFSTASFFKRVTNGKAPGNYVEIWLNFDRPSLAFDFTNLPSNPTPDGSVASIYGLDEQWVIVTQQKLSEFFESKKAFRPPIHGGGAYDLFLYFVVVPIFLWYVNNLENIYPQIFSFNSNAITAAVYIYGFLLVALGTRFIFQYARWLYPRVEYSGRSNLVPLFQKGLLGTVIIGAIGSALYDMIKVMIR